MRLGSVSIRLGRWLEIHSRRRPIDAATRSADCTLGAILESLSRLALIRFLFLFLFVSVFFLPSLFPCFGLLFLSVRSAPRFYLMPSFFFWNCCHGRVCFRSSSSANVALGQHNFSVEIERCRLVMESVAAEPKHSL